MGRTALHRRLGRIEDAIPYYQDVIASSPSDIEAREALVEVFGSLGRWGDLASLLFAMSQLADSLDHTLDYALRSSEIYAEQVDDVGAAQQVLRAVTATIMGTAVEDSRYADALRELGMQSDGVETLQVADRLGR